MATDFIMPRPPTTSSRDPFFQQPTFQAPYQYSAAANAQVQAQAQAQVQATASNFVSQYNPQISPLSTSNSSPTSPKSCYHTRQVRPMYIPAVLRPTEHPSREPTAKPKGRKVGDKTDGQDANGSAIDDGETPEDDEDDRTVGRSSGSFISLPGLGTFGIGRLTRRSTNDSGKCVDGSWNLELFPEVNGLPSREHWKPDPESSMCDEPTCKKHFNYFNRRHHCRRCGNIFCDMHSGFEIPLDENANYNPRGLSSRACSFCFREFKAWRTRNNSSDLTNGADGAKVPATAPVSPVMALSRGVPGAPGTPTVAKTPDVAQSVPGDWNWSTF